MKVHKLILNGTPDDGARLDDFCERLAAAEFAAGARLRALAVELVGSLARGVTDGYLGSRVLE